MQVLPPDSTFYFYRGRVALYALLRALDVKPGDEITVPGFTCVAVPSPILGLKATPVYVDIEPSTYNMDPIKLEKSITSRTRVIIAQHTFGIPCRMDTIVALAQKYSLAVIEDSCHVWGSQYKGVSMGSFGVGSFYSYDPGKPFIIGMGGAATVNSSELCREMARLYNEFQKPTAIETAKLHAQFVAHWATRNPRMFWIVRDLYRKLSKKGLAIATWTSEALQGELDSDYRKRLSPSLRSRLTRMIRGGEAVIARHRRLSAYYDRALKAAGITGVQWDPDSDTILICYPLQTWNKRFVLERAKAARVELGDWFSSPVHPLSEELWSTVGYRKGMCPIAEQVSRKVITLPCHAGVTEAEAQRIVGFLKEMKEEGLLVQLGTEPVKRSSSGEWFLPQVSPVLSNSRDSAR